MPEVDFCILVFNVAVLLCHKSKMADMSNRVEILQLQIPGGAIRRKDIVSFFYGKRWKQKAPDVYVTRYAATNFKLIENGENLNINIWIDGAFGVIVPYKKALLGRLDQPGFNKIVDDFKDHIINQNLQVIESRDQIEGLSQVSYLTIGIFAAVSLGIILYFLF